MKKPTRVLAVIIIIFLVSALGFLWINQNNKSMTIRQQLLKTIYPALMWFTRLGGVNARFVTHSSVSPPVSFETLRSILSNGQSFDWGTLKGKKVLIVNTASDCGYTAQYADLQQLAERYSDKLVVLGFPSNDFKEQEKGTDNAIHQFCQLNYGVRFPLMQKSTVLPGPQQHPVYQWLTKADQNGWNNKAPSWNFSKYLIDEEGRLILYADPSVSPLDSRLLQLIID